MNADNEKLIMTDGEIADRLGRVRNRPKLLKRKEPTLVEVVGDSSAFAL